MTKIFLIVALLASLTAVAQEFYLLNGEGEIYTYDYNTGTTQFIVEVNNPNMTTLTDIAFANTEHFYAIDSQGVIIDVDLHTGDATVVFEIPNDPSTPGLGYSSNNQLTTINSQENELITVDLNTNTIISEISLGTGNTGDITYYEGNMLFQGTMGLDLLAYDGTSVKSVACADFFLIWGNANYTTACGTNLVLGFTLSGAVWEYDLEAQTYSQIDTVNSTVGGVYGATTVNEQFAIDCPLVVLEEANCKFLREDYILVCEYNEATQTNSIRYLDLTYNLNHLFDVDLGGAILWDLAFSSKGVLYGITNSQEIIKINPNSTYELIAELDSLEGFESLVGKSDNQLVLIGSTDNRILTFDINTNMIVSEIEIPEGTPGDVTFYKGNILYQGMSNDMFAYDGVTTKINRCNDITPFRALTNRLVTCAQNEVVAIQENGLVYSYIVQGSAGLVFERDLSPEVDIIYGSANRREYLGSSCPWMVLPEDSCVLSTSEETIDLFAIYPNPTESMLFVEAANGFNLDQYKVYSVSGALIMEGLYNNGIDVSTLATGMYFIKFVDLSSKNSAINTFIKH